MTKICRYPDTSLPTSQTNSQLTTFWIILGRSCFNGVLPVDLILGPSLLPGSLCFLHEVFEYKLVLSTIKRQISYLAVDAPLLDTYIKNMESLAPPPNLPTAQQALGLVLLAFLHPPLRSPEVLSLILCHKLGEESVQNGNPILKNHPSWCFARTRWSFDSLFLPRWFSCHINDLFPINFTSEGILS